MGDIIKKSDILQNTHLHVLIFCSFLSGGFTTLWLHVLISWNELQKEVEGDIFSGNWYIIPIVLAILMNICVVIANIKAYLAIRKGGIKGCKLVKK